VVKIDNKFIIGFTIYNVIEEEVYVILERRNAMREL